jgi:hypothetical protein
MRKLLITMFHLCLLLVVAGCGDDAKTVSVDDAIAAFKNAGLEAESPRKMTKDDYGMAPMKAKEAKYILIPSLCEDCGGRVFSFENEEDLKQTKAYYDELGKESAMLFSWTLAKGNILVQLNGDLPEEKYKEYEKALNELE